MRGDDLPVVCFYVVVSTWHWAQFRLGEPVVVGVASWDAARRALRDVELAHDQFGLAGVRLQLDAAGSVSYDLVEDFDLLASLLVWSEALHLYLVLIAKRLSNSFKSSSSPIAAKSSLRTMTVVFVASL